MNSPHPSVTLPPMLAAWFLRHSRYLVLLLLLPKAGEDLDLDPPEFSAVVAPPGACDARVFS